MTPESCSEKRSRGSLRGGVCSHSEQIDQLSKMKAKIETKMMRTTALQNDTKLEKAKSYNEKHQQKVHCFQSEQQKELESKKSKIEDKLSKAAERRDEVIEQVKMTAAQSAALKI